MNLAIALAGLKQKVGLLDADVYGPNVPRMLGLMQANPTTDPSGKKLIPLGSLRGAGDEHGAVV